jgi:hypothetical protein
MKCVTHEQEVYYPAQRCSRWSDDACCLVFITNNYFKMHVYTITTYLIVLSEKRIYIIFLTWAVYWPNRPLFSLDFRSIRRCNLSIYGSTALCWALAAFSVSWSYTQSAGLLGRGISPSQGRYLQKGQHKHNKRTNRHPCLEWDSNPRSQCLSGRRQFMPETARPLWSVQDIIIRQYTKQIRFWGCSNT